LASFIFKIICYNQSNDTISQINKQKVAAIDWNDSKVPFTVGKPIENSCPEIMNYANNEVLKKFMYND
jgi:hypothetical protein